MKDYVCNRCGAAAYYDGRCGDGPVLICGCDKRGRSYIDTRGGAPERIWPNGADAVPREDYEGYDEDWAHFANR